MRAFSLALAAAALAACSSEDFERLKDEAAPVRETSHLVTARFERGAVVLTVTHTFHNPGLVHEELRQPLALPDGAVVTSLRIDGHREELLDAQEADERWATLRQPGLAEPPVSARLSRWPRDAVRLELYGLAPQSSVTLAYDVQLPPDPEDRQWRFTYAADELDGVALAAPTFDLTRMRGAMGLTGLGETGVHFPRAPIDRVDAKWAVYRLSAERAVWRFELGLPRRRGHDPARQDAPEALRREGARVRSQRDREAPERPRGAPEGAPDGRRARVGVGAAVGRAPRARRPEVAHPPRRQRGRRGGVPRSGQGRGACGPWRRPFAQAGLLRGAARAGQGHRRAHDRVGRGRARGPERDARARGGRRLARQGRDVGEGARRGGACARGATALGHRRVARRERSLQAPELARGHPERRARGARER